MRSNIDKDAYWAKTCLSLKFRDGFFFPKRVLNMVVMRGPPLEAVQGDRRGTHLRPLTPGPAVEHNPSRRGRDRLEPRARNEPSICDRHSLPSSRC